LLKISLLELFTYEILLEYVHVTVVSGITDIVLVEFCTLVFLIVDKGLILICGNTVCESDVVLVKLFVLDGYLLNVELGMLASDISGVGENDGVLLNEMLPEYESFAAEDGDVLSIYDFFLENGVNDGKQDKQPDPDAFSENEYDGTGNSELNVGDFIKESDGLTEYDGPIVWKEDALSDFDIVDEIT